MHEVALTVFYFTAATTAITGGAEMYARHGKAGSSEDNQYQAMTVFAFGLWVLADGIRWLYVSSQFARIDLRIELGKATDNERLYRIAVPDLTSALDWLQVTVAFILACCLISRYIRETYWRRCILLLAIFFGINAVYWLSAYFFEGCHREYVLSAKRLWKPRDPTVMSRPGAVYAMWAVCLGLAAMRSDRKIEAAARVLRVLAPWMGIAMLVLAIVASCVWGPVWKGVVTGVAFAPAAWYVMRHAPVASNREKRWMVVAVLLGGAFYADYLFLLWNY